MKTPKFLRELMRAPEYIDKNSQAYAMAEKYLQMLYPGQMIQDAIGRITDPEYDMTLKQFNAAQAQMDAELEESKTEAEDEYFEATGREIDADAYIELDETIDVRVLMPDGSIVTKHLEIYTLNMPESDNVPNGHIGHVWRWHSEDGDNTCDECASHDGEIYDGEDDIPDIPVHPNCRCSITEEYIGPDGRTISSKSYTQKKPTAKSDKTTSKEKATFEKPVDTKSGQYAIFDGKALTLYVDDKPVRSWDAVSGRPDFQSPEYQDRKSIGPIPEGTYVARQEKLQFMTPGHAAAGLGVVFDKKWGGWPGSYYSWGNSRVWLEPSKETNTYGRDKFSIHGGMWPGSAGCIDMTGQIGQFTYWLESTGKDLLVYVKY